MRKHKKQNTQFEKQLKLISYYLDRDAYTYSNLRRSALKAGYSDSYARKIGSYLNWQEMEGAVISVKEEIKKILLDVENQINMGEKV